MLDLLFLNSPKDVKKTTIDGMDWYEVAYTGKFVHPSTERRFSIDDEFIDTLHEYAQDMFAKGHKIPLVREHHHGIEHRLGDVIATKVMNHPRKSLWVALGSLTDEVKQIVNKVSFSIGTRPGKMESDGKTYRVGLIHLGVTNYPVLLGLQKQLNLSLFSETDLLSEGIKLVNTSDALLTSLGDNVLPPKDNNPPEEKQNVKEIAKALRLSEDAPESAIISAIGNLTKAVESMLSQKIEARKKEIQSLNLAAEETEKLMVFTKADKILSSDGVYEVLFNALSKAKPASKGFRTGDQDLAQGHQDDSEDFLGQAMKQINETFKSERK